MKSITSRPIKVELIIREGCNFSIRTLKSLLQNKKEYPGMSLEVIDIADSARSRRSLGGITPSIWVNNELWFLGSYSSEKFNQRMHSMVDTC